MYISQNIKYLRRKAGLNQKDLGDKINKSHGAIGEYERGKSLPPIDIILIFCDIFNVSLEDFVMRDIESDGISSTPKSTTEDREGEKDYKLLNKFLILKIKELAGKMKEQSPDLYKESELEEIMGVIEGY